MTTQKHSRLDVVLARLCANCVVCMRARRQQRGAAFWLVKQVEAKLCPFCRAYERVYGRKAHAPAIGHQSSPNPRTPPSP